MSDAGAAAPPETGSNPNANANPGQNQGRDRRRNRGPHQHQHPKNLSNYIGAVKSMKVLAARGEEYANKASMEQMEIALKAAMIDHDHGEEVANKVLTENLAYSAWLATQRPVANPLFDADPAFQQTMLEAEIVSYGKKFTKTQGTLQKLYNMLWGQLTTTLQDQIKNEPGYQAMAATCDVHALWTRLTDIQLGIDPRQHPVMNYLEQLYALMTVVQGPEENLSDYWMRVRTLVRGLKSSGGEHVFKSPQLVTAVDPDNPTDDELNTLEESCIAQLLLFRANTKRFDDYRNTMKTQYAHGNDLYQTTAADMVSVMMGQDKYKPSSNPPPRPDNFHSRQQRQGYQFAQGTGNTLRGRNGNPIVCNNCGGNHYATASDRTTPNPDCPGSRSGSGNVSPNPQSVLRTSFSFSQYERLTNGITNIPRSWVLLDTCSSDSIGFPFFVLGIRKCLPGEVLRLLSNGGGDATYDEIGTCSLLPVPMYATDNTLANILSAHQVSNQPNVFITMDTRIVNAMIVVHGSKGYVFRTCGLGLYYLDTNDSSSFIDYPNPMSSHSITSPTPAVQPTNGSTTGFNFTQLFTPSHQVVRDNKAKFTKLQVSKADEAREGQRIMHYPSDATFKQVVTQNTVKNCNFTVDDINRANVIYGPPIPVLQGKMTWTHPDRLEDIKRVDLPDYIREHHRVTHLLADLFYVNNLKFLLTRSTVLRYLHGQYIDRKGYTPIIDKLVRSIKKYTDRGFTVDSITGDSEFDAVKLRDRVAPVLVKTVAAGEHVGGIERPVRVIKERCRCTVQANPFDRVPAIMIVTLVLDVIDWLNAFPDPLGVSDVLSPAGLVDGAQPPDLSKSRLPCWTYALAYSSTTNDMKARSVPAIALHYDKGKGGMRFMSLLSGRKIHAHKWKALPMTDEVIDRVHELGENEGQPALNRNGNRELIFEWYPGVPVRDLEEHDMAIQNWHNELHPINIDDYDLNNAAEEEDDAVPIEALPEGEYLDDDNVPELEDNDAESDSDHDDDDDDDDDDNNNDDDDDINPPHLDDDNNNIDEEDIAPEEGQEPGAHDDPAPINENQGAPIANPDGSTQGKEPGAAQQQAPAEEPTVELRRSTRSNAGKAPLSLEPTLTGKSHSDVRKIGRQFFLQSLKYKLNPYKYGLKDIIGRYGEVYSRSDLLHKGLGVIFLQKPGEHDQISVTSSIKRFGEERTFASLLKEFSQLCEGAVEGKPVIRAIDPTELTNKEIIQALETVNQMKLKPADPTKGITEDELKARTCADGRKQRRFIDPEENTSSPTVSNDGNMTTLVVDVYEERDVAIADVKGAFLQAPTKVGKDGTRRVMKFRGKFAEIIAEVNPEFKQYLRWENGKAVLYVLILQAIYGTIDAALCWYELYSETLKKEGFIINPYDLCVANKMINGKQCTVSWYVDDNKISHKDPKVVDEVIAMLEKYFGKMKVSRGDKHKLLGMNITIDRKRKVIHTDMIDLLKEAQAKFETSGEIIRDVCPHPATGSLMTIRDNIPKLDENKAKIFHSVTATYLHVCKRTRPDLEVAISFLTRRVQEPDEDDWKKLRRVVQYCYGTLDEQRTIGATCLKDLFTWIDAAYAVHWDMKSHTGGCMSFGVGTLSTKSGVQKINVKSSTEGELVAMSEYLPYNLWMYHFMDAQGYKLDQNIIYQDNQAAIKMENNGRMSSTGRTRHINVRYFWVKDQVDQKIVKIEYCPTEIMLADFFTKPLNGYLFQYLKAFVMGHRPISELQRVSKEQRKINENLLNKADY